MRIALVGAPGTCKTCVAHCITDHFPDESFSVLDGYVERLSEKTDIAFGHFAGYIGNLQVAFERVNAEQEARAFASDTSLITCGTLMESIAYTTIHSQVALTTPDAGDKQAEFNRMGAAAATFSMLVWDTWRYDHVFYLPYNDELRQERDGTWDAVLDANLPYALDAFFIDYTTLTGTNAERAEQAVAKIKEANAEDAVEESADAPEVASSE